MILRFKKANLKASIEMVTDKDEAIIETVVPNGYGLSSSVLVPAKDVFVALRKSRSILEKQGFVIVPSQ